nr:MAG TPA: cytochrome C6 [Caudoviricetes sp.]
MLTEASVLLGMGSFSHKITDEDVQAIYNIINKYR